MSSKLPVDNQWLIRTHKNELFGPVSKDEVIAQIRAGKLSSQDEICLANQYWIYLDERSEVAKFLGVNLPELSGPILGDGTQETEEITLTETENDESPGGATQSPSSNSYSGAGADTSASRSTMANSGDLARLKTRAVSHKPMVVLGRAEGAGFLRLMGTVLVVLTSGLVIWIIRILQTTK